MKKLIVLLLLVLVGCSKVESPKTEGVNSQESERNNIDVTFKGKKLLITNHSEKPITLLKSETSFFLKEKGKWQSIDRISGQLSITYNVLSKETYEYDLTKELTEIGSKKSKVKIFYTSLSGLETNQYEKEFIYTP